MKYAIEKALSGVMHTYHVSYDRFRHSKVVLGGDSHREKHADTQRAR
jgi:hypothetical protein